MSEVHGAFSQDRRYWWDGVAWMPAQSPDGRSFRWTGRTWVRDPGRLGTETLIGVTSALSFVELVWLIVTIAILVSLANSEYEARGRVGTESITDSPAAIVMLLALLILPLLIVAVAAVYGGRRWWIGVLIGGWPPALIAFLALVSPGSGRVESFVAMAGVLAVMTAVGWSIHKVRSGSWKLSADGTQWVQGRKSYPTLSTDGIWRWDGAAWRRVTPGAVT